MLAAPASVRRLAIVARAPRFAYARDGEIFAGGTMTPLEGKNGLGGALDSGNSINTNCVGRWIFNEGSGAFARNLATGTNNTLQGAPPWTALGSDSGPALAPNSTYQGMGVTDLPRLSGAFTAFFRFNPGDVTAQYTTFADDWAGGATNYILDMEYGVVKFFSGNGSAATTLVGPTLSAGTLYNVVFVRSATTIKIYLNGVESATATTANLGYVSSNSRALFNVSSYGGQGLQGQIETAALWSRALTATEIAALHADPYVGI